MKPAILLLLLLISFSLGWPGPGPATALAQKDRGAPAYDQTPPRGRHHRLGPIAGRVASADDPARAGTGGVVELQTGLQYWENGAWLESRELIEIAGQGAIARHGPHRVVFSPDLHSPGSIDLLSPDGQRFRSHVLGLSYYDAS